MIKIRVSNHIEHWKLKGDCILDLRKAKADTLNIIIYDQGNRHKSMRFNWPVGASVIKFGSAGQRIYNY